VVERTVKVRLLLGDDYSAAAEKPILATTRLDDKLKGLGTQADRTDRNITGLGRTETKVAAETGLLAAQIDKTKEKLAGLNRELNETGDIKLLKDIRKVRSELNQLERSARDFKRLSPLGDEETKQPGPSSLQSTRSLGIGFNQLRSALIPMLIGVVVALAPMIGAIINGALLSGIGLGGLALGIVGQIKDPRVVGAAKAFGKSITDALTLDTTSFAQPLIVALGTIGDAVKRALSGINFDQLATTIGPLSRGISGLIDAMGPGLGKALAASVPLLNELEILLPEIGQALSFMFDQMSQGSDGAMEGLRTLAVLVIGLIKSLGVLVHALSDVYNFMVKFAYLVSNVADTLAHLIPFLHVFEPLTSRLQELNSFILLGAKSTTVLGRSLVETGDAATLTADDFAKLSGKIGQLTETQDTLAGKMTDFLVNSMLTADHAANNFQQSLTSLKETLDQNGRAIDKHTGFIARNTKEGEANRDAILAVVEANLRIYDSNIAVGMSAEDAAAKYNEGTRALRDQLRAAHFTEAQIGELIGKYENVPGLVNTTIAVLGLKEAIADLDETLRLIHGLPPRKDIEVWTHKFIVEQHQYSPPPPEHLNRGFFRAEGGNVEANQMYWVGERGRPELFVSRVPGTIYPTAQRYTGYRPAQSGGGTTHLEIRLSGEGPALKSLLALIRKEVRINGKANALGV
jgi:hypothetical protein